MRTQKYPDLFPDHYGYDSLNNTSMRIAFNQAGLIVLRERDRYKKSDITYTVLDDIAQEIDELAKRWSKFNNEKKNESSTNPILISAMEIVTRSRIEGKFAFLAGLSYTDCPYTKSQELETSGWLDGWTKAKASKSRGPDPKRN